MTEPAPRLLYRAGDAVPAIGAGVPQWAVDLRLDELAPLLGDGDLGHRRLAVMLAHLPDADAIAYRHEVFRDLEATAVSDAFRVFGAALDEATAMVARARRMRHPAERDRWLLDAMERHDAAVLALAAALGGSAGTSRALLAVLGHLERLTSSDTFRGRRAAVARTRAALDSVTFRMRIGEQRVVVSPVASEPDLAGEIRDTFARVRDGEPAPLHVDVFDALDMNPLEAEILTRVARLAPEPFALLAATVSTSGEVVDPALAALADDAAWYLAVRDALAPVRDAGVSLTYPAIVADGAVDVVGVADLLVARRLAGEARSAATSSLRLAPGERVVIVTGPSQSGRTSFARALGQLHVLAAAGCPVPATSAAVPLVSDVQTIFDQAERLDDPGGRLRTELRRIRSMLEAARPQSLVVANEPFASTTASDALALARRLLDSLAEGGARVLAVTFLEELAVEPRAISVAAVMQPDDRAALTFRFERRPPDGLAHAQLLAAQHGLGAASVEARIRR